MNYAENHLLLFLSLTVSTYLFNNMAPKRKVSHLWNHFDEVVPSKKAKCSYCFRVLAISSSSIGSLSRHLKSNHPTIEINSQRQPESVPDSIFDTEQGPSNSGLEHTAAPNNTVRVTNRPVGPSMVDYIVNKKPLPRNKIQMLDEQLVKMIAEGYHALRIVEEIEFRKFVEMLSPGYTLPTRKTLSESLLPKVYNKVLEAVQIKISKAAAICITTDAWTSIVNDGYIAITAHFIDTENHKLCTAMLGCIEFEERHTSENLKNFLLSKFTEWNIHRHVNVIVSDNAPNVLNAIRLGGWRSIPCYAHTLNLVVQSSIQEIDTVNRVKSIVEYFHRSNPAKKKLLEIQDKMGLTPLKLKMDVVTRWNSTYDMLVRVLKMKEALISTLAIMRPDLNLPLEDWEVIKESTILLKIFYDVTVEVSGEEYVSASKYIVYTKIINQALNKYTLENSTESVQRLHQSLKSQMKQRFGEVEKNVLLCEATILDPRFKKKRI